MTRINWLPVVLPASNRRIALAMVLVAAVATPAVVGPQARNRTITIQAGEFTTPAVAVTPDERMLIFSALGHLYQVPVAGGAATQLTTGPFYDGDPAISPDGTRVAFVSNRDGSSSNVFVLDLASRRVTQVTREREATRPAWSPDGRTIAYARNLAREEHPFEQLPGFGDTGLRELRTVPAAGGQPTVVGPPRIVETVFFLPDGRLAWTVRDMNPGGGSFQTVKASRIETQGPDGTVAVLATVPGDIGRVTPGAAGNGVYYNGRGGIQWLAFAANSAPSALAGIRLQDAGSRLALAPKGSHLYFADAGQFWRVSLPSGDPQRIPVTASMALDVRPPVPIRWMPPAPSTRISLRAVMAPSITPDGSTLAVMAGGLLWEQPLAAGGAARQVDTGKAFARDPIYSPDGRSLAYVASENGRRTLNVYDLGTRQAKTVFATGGAAWPLYPSWSPDGTRIVFQHTTDLGAPFRIVIVNVADGRTQEIARTVGSWVARPHFSGDGRSVFFTNRPGKIGALYRVATDAPAAPQALTEVSRHVHEGLVSPDGRWMAQRRNSEIWIAPMGAGPIRDAQLRRLSPEGGRSFSFTPDSAAVVYTAGGRVWRQALSGGNRTELRLRIEMPHAVPPPLLLTRLRVLDSAVGRFSDQTSLFVEDGRIRWIGAEHGRSLPAGTVRLDAAGRYAVPGLFDTHVHSAWQNQQTNEDAFIAFGLTSVRDTGGTLDLLTALDDRANATSLAVPRYFYSGEIFEGLMPLWGDAFFSIGSAAEARAEVRNLKAWGADFVKVYPSLPWHLQEVVAEEAHRVGLPAVGHGQSVEEITRRVVWGFTSLEHSGAVFSTYEDVHKMIAAAGIAADLTMSVGGGTLMRVSDPAWQNNWRVREFVPEEVRRPGRGDGGPFPLGSVTQPRDELLQLYKPRFDRLMAARSRGVPMASGTDALMGGVFFGLSLHWEIGQFADAGVPPIDVLRMATEGAAALVGSSADLGTLTSGKLADIVLLDANPLEDIRNTQRVWQVVRDGRIFDPARLRPSATPAATR